MTLDELYKLYAVSKTGRSKFEAIIASQRQEAVDALLSQAIYAERASYKPIGHDTIRNWPITEDVYLVPAKLREGGKQS